MSTGRPRVLLQAAGVGYRWHDHLGVRKHKILIDGEPIIDRTVRQLRDLGCDDIWVISDQDDYRLDGTTLHLPDGYAQADNQVSAFLLTQPVWSDATPTVLLYGDIYWTDEAIADVINYQGDPWHVWYRPGGSQITGRGHGEVYAHLFTPAACRQEFDACQRVVDLHRAGLLSWKNTCGWTIYRAMLGLPDDQIDGYSTPEHDHATVVDDWTEDFDSPGDYVGWYGRWSAGRYPARIIFEGTPASTRALWPAIDAADPRALVIVCGDVTISDTQLWCGITHAVEHGVTVIPYSHAVPASNSTWQAEPMWTAHTRDRRIVILPLGETAGGDGDDIRLDGPCRVMDQ